MISLKLIRCIRLDLNKWLCLHLSLGSNLLSYLRVLGSCNSGFFSFSRELNNFQRTCGFSSPFHFGIEFGCCC